MKLWKFAAAADELLEAAGRCGTSWTAPCASARDGEEDASVMGGIKCIPGNTYTIPFLTSGEVLWGCRSRLVELLEGRRRSQILPTDEGRDLPGGRPLFLPLFRIFVDFCCLSQFCTAKVFLFCFYTKISHIELFLFVLLVLDSRIVLFLLIRRLVLFCFQVGNTIVGK